MRSRGRWVLLLPLLLALGAGVSAGGSAEGQTSSLTVYSSLPLQGVSRASSRAVVNGIRMALSEAGGRAGPYSIGYVSLDDATRKAGQWDAGKTSANARRAAENPRTIAYIGEYNSGASAISIPILNEEGILQISPSNTANGLTVGGPGTAPGEPDKYFRRERNYLRLVPRDTYEGAAMAALMGRRHCRRAALLSDGELYGEGVAHGVKLFARHYHVKLVVKRRFNYKARNYRRLARRIRRRRPRCIAYAGVSETNAVQLFHDLSRPMPHARFFGPAGIALTSFTKHIPRRARRRALIVFEGFPPSAYPLAGRAFFKRYIERYGRRALDVYAIYGYEAMKVVLDNIERQGGSRSAVLRGLFATSNRKSVLGTYSFDKNGDTSLIELGAYRITRSGALRFVRVVRPRR